MTRTTTAEPPSNGVGTPPAHLTDDLRALWVELAADVPTGVATTADRHAFGLLVALCQRARSGNVIASEAAQMRQLLDDFVLTPSARQRRAWQQSCDPRG